MTSPSPLERLAGPGNVLAKEPPDAKEFAGLVRSGLARLKDAENEANSLDGRFISPTAPPTHCVWWRSGTTDPGHRNGTSSFRCCRTSGPGPEVWRVLSKCDDTPNGTEYEASSMSTTGWSLDPIGACRKVARKVERLPAIQEKSK